MRTPNTLLIQMGAKIKSKRKEKNLSYPQMSKLIGMDMSNYWFLENGERNCHILTLRNIAEVLGCDLKEFL
jgi:transcriptional regulator with XRE-family HTH domain